MKLLKPKTYRFCLNPATSPTYWNLGQYLPTHHWTATRYRWRSHFNESHFEFDPATTQQLEYKHLLAELVQAYCPHTMPLTYRINDTNWQAVLTQLLAQPQLQNLSWILKPSLLNNGQHIHIFKCLEDLAAHYSSHQRLGGEHVLQYYIDTPHLLKQHKYSIRMFVILSDFMEAYLYPEGYFNVAKSAYTQDITNLMPHLTNEHLCDPESNVIQIPTDRFDFFAELYPQINAIVQQIVSALKYQYPQSFISENKARLAIFGFDFLVDANLRVWLLEANHGPCFPTTPTHPLQQYLYQPFWEDFIKRFVLPILRFSIE